MGLRPYRAVCGHQLGVRDLIDQAGRRVALADLIPSQLKPLLEGIIKAGGRPMLVGGCVRDALMGFQPKDIDIEVYGLDAETLKARLKPFGRVLAVGVSFGVLKVYLPDKTELDISIPRLDSHRGELGYLGVPDPTVTPQEAASRRDFTINALLFDPASNELLDFFGGQADLAAGILRHVGPAFAEDPVRVLRGMQFAARWNFRLASETVNFCAALLPAYPNLLKERIWGEWHKFLTKGLFPEAGLTALKETHWHQAYPALVNLQQNGGWEATLAALKRIIEICQQNKLDVQTQEQLMLVGLCSQFTLEEARQFLAQLNVPQHLVKPVLILLQERTAYQSTSSPDATTVRWLAYRLTPLPIIEWLRLVEATDPNASVQSWLELAQSLGYADGQIPLLLQGRHLLEAGLVPGKHFKVLLDQALENQLNGLFTTHTEAQQWLHQQLEKK